MSFLCVSSALVLGLAIQPAAAQTAAPPRVIVSVNAGAQASSPDFTRASTLLLNQEAGPMTVGYRASTGAMFDAGGAFRLRPKLWLGVAVSRFSKNGSGDVTAELPHPFFFNRRRTVSGTAADLGRSETAVHVSAVWDLVAAGRWQVKAFGGPTFFSARQDLVIGVEFEESFPFDTASYIGERTDVSSTSAVGFHVGADFSTDLTPAVGVGALLRYSRGEGTFGNSTAEASATLGGAHVAAGIRLRF